MTRVPELLSLERANTLVAWEKVMRQEKGEVASAKERERMLVIWEKTWRMSPPRVVEILAATYLRAYYSYYMVN